MNEFYGAVSAACFALLGLWWVVIELNHGQWLGDRALRRTAGRVSLYFLIPGTMSLLSMIDDSGIFWRVVFLSGAAVGLGDAILAARAGPTPGASRAFTISGFAVFAAVAVVAAVPGLAHSLGIPPLAVEAVLVTLLLLLGAWMAWHGMLGEIQGRRAP